MGRRRSVAIGVSVVGLVAAVPSSAMALTLGNTTLPSGAIAGGCSNGSFYAQTVTDSASTYVVPAGGGQITSWSFNTTGASSGTSLALLLLRPASGGFTVVGFDNEIVPPSGGIATFNLATPVSASAGDVLGIYLGPGTANCYFFGGPISPTDIATAGPVAPPSVGAAYATTQGGLDALVNVSANLVQSEDAGLRASATPTPITAGGVSEYQFTVSNAGVSAGPISFTDTVPAGLNIISAVAGDGSCATSGHSVSCTLSSVPVGGSAPVSIVVSAPSAGAYSDNASVSTGAIGDPNPANNGAGATLTVAAPSCKVVRLKNVSLSIAKLVIRALNCKVSKVTKKASRSVPKGEVISTSPGPGATGANGTPVKVVVSSGPRKKKK